MDLLRCLVPLLAVAAAAIGWHRAVSNRL
jgi:hypothetical protein